MPMVSTVLRPCGLTCASGRAPATSASPVGLAPAAAICAAMVHPEALPIRPIGATLLCDTALEDNLLWPVRPGSAIRAVNLPNSITMTRIFSIPLLIWLLLTDRISSLHGEKELLASAVFVLASITDGLDGYLARRRGQVTTMGMLLDPLADKLMITAAFITLVQVN